MSNHNKTLADVQPGGRVRLGDQLVLAKLVDAAGLMLAEIDTCGHEVDQAYRHTLYEAWEEGKAALSAQPSPGGQDAQRIVVRVSGVGQCTLTVNDGAIEIPAETIAALAARQPVGEPVAWVRPEQLEAHADPLRGEGGHYLPTRKTAAGKFTQPLYAAPPAQAVDLGAMRALLQRRIAQWRSHLPADPGAPGTREIETKGEHDYNNDVRIYREGIAVMEEVLSKIDGQAVGNG
jgi:hypothetical protein